MNELEVLPAPTLLVAPEDKWHREQRAFRLLLPDLLKTYRGKFVAIHEGQMVEAGTD